MFVGKVQTVDAHPFDNRLLNKILDLPATDEPDKPKRVKKGRNLFFNETFGGNGRTCGTCHLETGAFTIDAADIAQLPSTDPLFVNERVPALAALENSALLRGFGLVCENLDGFNNPCVFRGVPHTLALPTSINPNTAPPNGNALGWSGDGSPGPLRNFVIGAIVQHFPLTLNRVEGVDFRLPTKQELRAMETFQRSLGRQTEISLDGVAAPALVFADPFVEHGKALFLSAPSRNGTTRSCNGCHGDAGANNANGINANFNTGVSRSPKAPKCRNQIAPGDGGLNQTPEVTAAIACANGSVRTTTFRGDGTFNTPPLIEAADTGPFFHNNTAATIEAAITFYTSETFNASPAGNGNAFVLSPGDINDIGGLLRALNARQNVIDGIALDGSGKGNTIGPSRAIIARALSETNSAIRVLTTAPAPIYQGTTIVDLLRQAAAAEQRALVAPAAAKVAALSTAITLKRQALVQFTE